MIYSVYWDSCVGRVELAQAVRGAETGDSFVFIYTIRQEPQINTWLESHQLNDLIAFRMERPITNQSHPDSGRRLILMVLSKTKLEMKIANS